ncbi:hypothetical protein T4C_2616 [Trichinella pseudospiralis]|uniref:Uncharacterized protein n=1 Tax=Trichinella pseudospiralis TaxID=6337 RepID=A0A0V1JLY8_TRIPS|nr:hypothetical protein T4C_2616 [Trichinella pseudospiralis]
MGFKNDNQVRFPVEFLPQFTNDSAEQEQPLRDCPSQRFNKPDSYHHLFIVSWITRKQTSTSEEISDKLINYLFAPLDMPVATTLRCCEKPDRNGNSQDIRN